MRLLSLSVRILEGPASTRDSLGDSFPRSSHSIARRHGALIPLTQAERAITALGDGEGIPPGPFLDELKANGLVTCTTQVKYDASTELGFGKPELVCV